MKKINREELKAVIMDYVNCSLISEPLLISFGKHEEPIALKIIKQVYGDSNSFKIVATYDNPRADIPYCLFDAYYGNADNELLLHCFEIANNIHRPVFCFISSSYEEEIPKELYNKSYKLIEEKL